VDACGIRKQDCTKLVEPLAEKADKLVNVDGFPCFDEAFLAKLKVPPAQGGERTLLNSTCLKETLNATS